MPGVPPSATSHPADPLIERNRTADATVTVKAGGQPLAGQQVIVAQRRHKILLGTTGFDLIPLANDEVQGAERARLERLAEEYVKLFNFTTLPFYWGNFEKERGKPDTARVHRTAEWFAERGIPSKGHPLCWHTVQPGWLLEMSNAEIWEAQRARIVREVTNFRDVIHTWDAINEAVIMPVFENGENGITRIAWEHGRVAMVRLAFETARATDPTATLILNDFDMSTAYECLIEAVLEAGIKVDALGLQSHMHQGYWGEEKTLKILDRFARYGLPIHFTETTILSGHLMPPEIVDLNDYQVTEWPTTPEGEERQADETVRHYKTLLSHPAVEAVTWWDPMDDGWLHAPAGLLRADATPKPAFEALLGLFKGAWWLKPTTMTTDEQGRLNVHGFLGEYELSLGGETVSFALDRPGSLELEVRLPA